MGRGRRRTERKEEEEMNFKEGGNRGSE